VVVVDNGSTDGSVAFVREAHPQVKVVPCSVNGGFARGVNAGARAATGDALVLLNNDAAPSPGWLAALLGPIDDGTADVVGGKILDWEGKHLQFGQGVLTFDGHAFQDQMGLGTEADPFRERRRSLFACGGNMAVRRSLFLELGGFDEDFFAYFEDVDFGWRACLAGHRVILEPAAVVRHRGAATSSRLDPFDRGFLFEVNAFQTAVKNLGDEELRSYLPAILLTLLSRLQSLTVRLADDDGQLSVYPFGPEGYRPSPGGPGLVGRLLGASHGLRVTHPHGLSYARSVEYILTHLDAILAKRQAIQSLRRVPDGEILSLVEVAAVPTYPGDEELFRSAFFRYLLPKGVTSRTMASIQHSSPY
jgi:GT2 family glycosyltransferase